MRILCIKHQNYILECDRTGEVLTVRRRLGRLLRINFKRIKYVPTSLKYIKWFMDPEQNEGWVHYQFICISLCEYWSSTTPCATSGTGVFGSSNSIRNGPPTFMSRSQYISWDHLLMGYVCGALNLFLQPMLPSAILRNLLGEISDTYIW